MEFAEYLSPTARPGKNKNRLYSVSDMEVIALVADQKATGQTYPEIHASLINGQRGSVDLSPEDMRIITAGEGKKQLSLEIEHLQHAIVRLKTELEQTRQEAEEARQLREEAVRLQTSLEHISAQLQETQERLDQAHKHNEELSREVGREYAKGFVDGISQHKENSIPVERKLNE
jgi:DNA-binding transcriptional MerR regulator